MMAGLFAVFSAAPRVFLEHFGFSPVTLGLMFAGVVVLVFGASMLAPRIVGMARFLSRNAGRPGIYGDRRHRASCSPCWSPGTRSCRSCFGAAIFLFGVGIVSPLSSAAALSPFADKAGVAAALFGFAQMAGAACGAMLAAVVSSDPGAWARDRAGHWLRRLR